MGFKFSTKSLFMMPHIGDIEDIIGTSIPIKAPPSTAPKVGVTSYEYPKKKTNKFEIKLNVK